MKIKIALMFGFIFLLLGFNFMGVSADSGGSYTVLPGDSLITIATAHGLQWEALASTNHIYSPYIIYPGQVLSLDTSSVVPVSTTGSYTVVYGDTLYSIAQAHSLDWQALAAANNIGAPYIIYPGQVLSLNTSSVVPVSTTGSYTVVYGDTLYSIAQAHGLDWQALAAANNINAPYIIQPGQVLSLNTSSVVPVSTTGGYTVVSGDTLYSIAQAHGLDWQALAAANNINAPYIIQPGQALSLNTSSVVPVSTTGTYTVAYGDTLYSIAQAHGLDWQALATANNIYDPFIIYPGQALSLDTSKVVSINTSSGGTHTVIAGDTLIDIAASHNVNWETLASLNNITYPYLIYPGQVLSIPTTSTSG